MAITVSNSTSVKARTLFMALFPFSYSLPNRFDFEPLVDVPLFPEEQRNASKDLCGTASIMPNLGREWATNLMNCMSFVRILRGMDFSL